MKIYRRDLSTPHLSTALSLLGAALSFVLFTAIGAAAAPSALTVPADGATNVDPGVVLTWAPTTGAMTYRVAIGTAQGDSDVADSGSIVGLSYPAVNLVSNTTYWVRLVTYGATTTSYSDSSFTTGVGTGRVAHPANNTTGINAPVILLTWSSDPTATAYYPYVGTAPGANDVYNAGETAQTHIVASGFQPNTDYYVRLWVKRGSVWSYTDTTFRTGGPAGVLTYPPDNATDVDGPVILFRWSSDAFASAYYLYVGTSVGANNVYDSGETSQTNIPASDFQPNTEYYVRLWVKRGSEWSFNDTTFRTGAPGGVLTYPADGASGVTPTDAHFAWTPATSAVGYCILVGTTPGSADVFYRCPVTVTTETVGNLLGNQTYYVRVITWKVPGGLSPFAVSDSSFTTGELPTPADRADFYARIASVTSQVRLMADISTNIPLVGSLLETKVAIKGLPKAFCTEYAETLVELLLDDHIAARTRSILLNPIETHVVTEYYDPFVSKWAVADATFGVMYFNDTTQVGASVEDLSALVNAADWTHIPLKWVTPYNDSVWQSYYLDPILLYLNPLPVAQAEAPPSIPNDPETIIAPLEMTDVVGVPGDYIFRFAQPTDAVTMKAAPELDAATIGVAPPTVEWATAQQTSPGWSVSSYPMGLRVYALASARIFKPTTGLVIAPADGATAVNPTAIAIAWSGDPIANSYIVHLGSAVGGKDVLESAVLSPSERSVLTPPLAPNTTYYVRLFVDRGNHWTYTDSRFTTKDEIGAGIVTSPADNITQVPPGAVTITWTRDPDASSYYPYLGTAQGLNNVVNFGEVGTSTFAVTAYNLAANSTYWIRLYAIRPDGLRYTDTKFTTGSRTGLVVAPVDGATAVNPGSVTITWSADPTASAYYPYLGTQQGLNDAWNFGVQNTGTTSVTALNLEPNRNYWIRMWVLRGAKYFYTDTQFTTGDAGGTISSPSDGATNINPGAVAISWSSDPSATSYFPYLGTSQGLNDVFNFGERPPTTTSITAVQLAPNTTYWVRLWVNRMGAWSYRDSSFTTGAQLGRVTVPSNGATGIDPSVVPIVWEADPTAAAYYPYLGSAQGMNDVINFGEQSAGTTHVTATGLASNTTYWIRMWVLRANQWSFADYQFSTGDSFE